MMANLFDLVTRTSSLITHVFIKSYDYSLMLQAKDITYTARIPLDAQSPAIDAID